MGEHTYALTIPPGADEEMLRAWSEGQTTQCPILVIGDPRTNITAERVIGLMKQHILPGSTWDDEEGERLYVDGFEPCAEAILKLFRGEKADG